MKKLLFLCVIITFFATSCTIQKRVHLPGYHSEWGGSEANRNVANETKPQATMDCAYAKQVEQNAVIEEAQSIEKTPEAVAEVTSFDEKTSKHPVIQKEELKSVEKPRKLSFPKLLHSPVRFLYGGVKPNESKTDGLSIAAMVCGILSFISLEVSFILAILGIVFGAISLGTIRRNPDLKGKGMAITGLVLGILALLALLALALWVSFIQS